MPDKLTIRSYSPVVKTHEHNFHQIVIPLHGVIEITVNHTPGSVGVGQSVIIQKSIEHDFYAGLQSRFLVADLDDLPDNARNQKSPFAAISNTMQKYCLFVESQLQHSQSKTLQETMLSMFKQLLAEQDFVPKIDSRISQVLAYIENHIHTECSLAELADKANLSVSHFKAEFKKQTGLPSSKYLLQRRMEKARALLMNTDIPIQIIAEKAGYPNPSAFSRRFAAYFGEPPRQFKSR